VSSPLTEKLTFGHGDVPQGAQGERTLDIVLTSSGNTTGGVSRAAEFTGRLKPPESPVQFSDTIHNFPGLSEDMSAAAEGARGVLALGSCG